MNPKRSSGAWRVWAFAALALVASCAEMPQAPKESPRGVLVESLFLEKGEHPVERCLSGLAKSLRELHDGVLFFDRENSKVRVTPPRGPDVETYHVHLVHRVGADVLDYVARQNEQGIVELDLARFDQPEELLVVSSSYRYSKREESAGSDRVGREEEALTPPYALSFRLVPADQLDLVTTLQPFRYVVETTLGNLSLFVQSFNRRDMLLTWIDPAKKLGGLIKEDPYVHLKKQDAYIPPRLVVDVLPAKGDLPWQRAGTWHLPASSERSGGEAERPFAFRVPGQELISFGPPARVDFTLPAEAPATSATVEAKYAGVRPKDALKLVFAVQVPAGRGKEPDFRIETKDVDPGAPKRTFVADLSDQDPSKFPINAALVHRLVQPWRLHGGAYAPEKPLGTATVALKQGGGPGKIHPRVVAARYASHFDFLSFLGGVGKSGKGDSLLEAAPKIPGSPNTTPPPRDPSVTLLPPAGPAANPSNSGGGARDLAGGGGGGPSTCGCGPGPAPGMPSPGCPSKNKCKGQCGQACPGDGHCKDDRDGMVTVQFPCPPSPKGCQQDRSKGECKCGPHPWDKDRAMAAVVGLFPGAADYSWFGPHNGWAPCDEATPIGRVRISFWAAAGFGMTHVWCGISASFGPCLKDPVAGGGPGGGPVGGGGPNGGGSGGGLGAGAGSGGNSVATNASAATVTGRTSTSVPTSGHPVGLNDPNTMLRVDTISDALGVRGALNTGFLFYDEPTLALVLSGPALSIAEAYHAAHQNTVPTSMANADTELNLPFFLEGLLEAVGQGGSSPPPGGVIPPGGGIPPLPPGCGALGIDFILGAYLLTALLRRIFR